MTELRRPGAAAIVTATCPAIAETSNPSRLLNFEYGALIVAEPCTARFGTILIH
ncbi:hypothetical protein [Burkholderia diffusa]|uniref:hypothetical protein n=1 Tax=Burkholderia diffusa TaxID=488732 RepID=UPI0012DB36CA|nr:hypothetical protein [Burkholderia diffusa]